jgi:zinc protease
MNTMRIANRWLLALVVVVGACDKKTEEAKADPKAAATEAKTTDAKGTAEPSNVDGLPDAEAILAKAVDAVGGKDKLATITSFHLVGKLLVTGQNITGDLELWWKDGDFYTEQKMVGIGEIRAGKQGAKIWSEDPINGRRELTGLEAEQHTWASSLLLAADWKRYFATAETIGKRDKDGKTLYDVKLKSASGAEVELSFDAESGLQVAQKFQQDTPLGKMPVAVEMQDYRDVDGLKLPFKQVTDASLAKATQEIVSIEFNVPIDTEKFAMPTGGAPVVEGKAAPPPDNAG